MEVVHELVDSKDFKIEEIPSHVTNAVTNLEIKKINIDFNNSDINKLFYEDTLKIEVSKNEHLFFNPSNSFIRFTSADGINYIQHNCSKNILRFSNCYSTVNLLEIRSDKINIGESDKKINLNIFGSLSIDEKNILSTQCDAIPDDLTLEEKVNSILYVLRHHGLIDS